VYRSRFHKLYEIMDARRASFSPLGMATWRREEGAQRGVGRIRVGLIGSKDDHIGDQDSLYLRYI
jgi:hypothetical protein